MENQNKEELRKIEGNHNKEGSDSQANRRIRTAKENSSRMKSMLHNIRREMDELRNAVKDRVIENLDGVIQRMDSPFTTKVLKRPLPPKFRIPQLESFDGSRDPLDHIESFKTSMLLQITLDEVMCKTFPTTLKGVTRVWFGKLPSGTIANFDQLSKGFVRHFIGRQRHKKPTGYLLIIR